MLNCLSRRNAQPEAPLLAQPILETALLFWLTVGAAGAFADQTSVTEQPRSLEPTTIVEAKGTARFVRRSLLTFGSAGKIEQILVDEGDVVEKGDLLASLWDDTAVARLAEAETAAASRSALHVAARDLESAQAELDAVERANQAHPRAFSQLRATKLHFAWRRAQDFVQQRQEEVDLAQCAKATAAADLAGLRLTAPFSGLIVRRLKNDGEGVNPGDGVLEIVDDSRVRIDIFVAPHIADQLQVGMPVEIIATGAGPSYREPFQIEIDSPDSAEPLSTETTVAVGQLGFVDLSIQPVRGVVRAWVEADRPAWLRDGAQVQVRITPANQASKPHNQS